MVVNDKRVSPAGRKPLSRSSSHSYPRVFAASVATAPGPSVAIAVFLQKRFALISAGTLMAVEQQFTVKIVPVSAFSGFVVFDPDGPCGLNGRGSRQVPVQSGDGSIFVVANVSL